MEMEVLPEEEEARLAFVGATRTLPTLPIGEVGVVDVGGGSSELVAGTLTGGVSWCVSLDVGSGLLTDAYVRADPPAAEELDAVRVHVAECFAGVDAPQPRTAYAVGGSATSLYRLVGPNFHSISFAYALAFLSVVLTAGRRWWFALLAFPLLVVIGSKGALIFVLLVLAALVVSRSFKGFGLLWCFAAVLAVYAAAGIVVGIHIQDYHVIGFFGGLRGFLSNPLGHGICQVRPSDRGKRLAKAS